MTTFTQIIDKFRREAWSEREKGFRFERLIQAYLKTTALYEGRFEKVWLWTEFPYHDQFGGKDIGTDLNVFHSLMPDEDYKAFDDICLTDTFQLGEDLESDNESRDALSDVLPQNSQRVKEQRELPITIIMGNPPYSVGQRSANDNAQNLSYPTLEKRIEETYARRTNATNKNSLYDSYIKVFRWASDRFGKKGGIIGFVTNGTWLDGNAQDGLRKCFEQEFSSIYVFNLRGNQRTSGELSRKEGGKIFGSGSRTPIAITILVKKGE